MCDAFVPGFKYDVFISYAWVNNAQKGPGGKWVSEFRRRLGAALDARLGRQDSFKFFFDIETLGRNVDFGPQIEEALEKPATVVAVISRGYIESPHCREEMRFFDQIVQGPVSKSGRLYLVWYDAHDAKSDWPAEYRKHFDARTHGVIGYDFFAPVESVPSGKPRRPRESAYQTSLLQLTTALASYLTDLRNQSQFAADPAAPPAAPDTLDDTRAGVPTVLIGQSAPDRSIRRKRRDLANWCRNAGLDVLGENEYSLAPADFKAEFARDLRQAHLLVQLFCDKWLAGDDDEFPSGPEAWLQQQAAEGGDIVQWRDSGIARPTADERAALDDDKRRHFDMIFGSQVMTAEPAELHRFVVERARAAFDVGPIAPLEQGDRSLLIKVTEDDYHRHEATMLEIGNHAQCGFAHNGRSVVERYRRRKFDAVMVVLGEGCTQDWRDDREDELIESTQSFRNTGPIHAWFDAGDYPGAPPLLAPGLMLIKGKQELPNLFQAIEKKGGAK